MEMALAISMICALSTRTRLTLVNVVVEFLILTPIVMVWPTVLTRTTTTTECPIMMILLH
jgi:hypothetical protein